MNKELEQIETELNSIQIERLEKENAKLQERINNYQLADNQRTIKAKIDSHFSGKNMARGAVRVLGVLVRERVSFEGSKPIFKDENGEKLNIKDVSKWIESLENEGLSFTDGSTSKPVGARPCKSAMTPAEKATYKKQHGYDAYNALPFK